jgi:cytoskeleton protein RodZ
VQRTMTVGGAEFGQELRSQRERRGISLERLCAETKVNPRHLQALEAGSYRELPGGIFRKGIVRAYLRAAGLDESEWMERFQASYTRFQQSTGVEAESADDAWATFALNVKRNRGRMRDATALRWVGVFVLLLALVAGGWAMWHYLLAHQLAR